MNEITETGKIDYKARYLLKTVNRMEIEIRPLVGVLFYMDLLNNGDVTYYYPGLEDRVTEKIGVDRTRMLIQKGAECFSDDIANADTNQGIGAEYSWKISFYNRKGFIKSVFGYPDESDSRLQNLAEVVDSIEWYTNTPMGIRLMFDDSNKCTRKTSDYLWANRITRFLQQMIPGTSDDFMMSSLDILSVLKSLILASAGDSRKELLLSSGINLEELDQLTEQLEKIIARSGGCVNHANGIYVDSKFRPYIMPEFISDSDSVILPEDCEQINEWVKKETHGMVSGVANDLSELGDLDVISAASFIADWEEEYEQWDIKTGKFHNLDGSISSVQYLKSVEGRYICNNQVTGFIKPYRNCGYSFMGLLPNGKRTPEDILAGLNAGELQEWFKSAFHAKVSVKMPEFKYEIKDSLTKAFNSVGIHKVFDKNQANLENLINLPEMYIDDIRHQSYIKVDRYGTRAAEVVECVVCYAGIDPLNYKTDFERPFIYCISDNKSGFPVFIGVVNHI